MAATLSLLDSSGGGILRRVEAEGSLEGAWDSMGTGCGGATRPRLEHPILLRCSFQICELGPTADILGINLSRIQILFMCIRGIDLR